MTEISKFKIYIDEYNPKTKKYGPCKKWKPILLDTREAAEAKVRQLKIEYSDEIYSVYYTRICKKY